MPLNINDEDTIRDIIAQADIMMQVRFWVVTVMKLNCPQF